MRIFQLHQVELGPFNKHNFYFRITSRNYCNDNDSKMIVWNKDKLLTRLEFSACEGWEV